MGSRKDLYKDIIIKPLSAFSEDTEQNDNVELILDLMRERGKRC